MIIAEGHYTEEGIIERLANGLHVILSESSRTPLFLCIGSPSYFR